MALQKAHDPGVGFTGNYWKIIDVYIDDFSTKAYVKVGLWKDSTARTNKNIPLTAKQYTWCDTDYPFTDSALAAEDPWKIAYDKMKLIDSFWDDATNV